MSDNPQGFSYYGRTPHGVEMAITLSLEGIDTPNDIAEFCEQLDSALHAKKFTRSDRLDKPSYQGGGGRPGAPRPEAQPPADLVVPEHCGVSMIYRPPKEADGNRKAVAARWECRKGSSCEEAEERGGNKYGATNWHLTKKAETNGTAEKTFGFGNFLTAALKDHGNGKAAVLKFAGVKTDEELRALGPEGWADLLDKMKVANQDVRA